jgi:hypothetical protein
MKNCKDCKWVVNPGEFARCACPRGMSNRTGFEKTCDIAYCSIQRDAGWLWSRVAPNGRCGRAGYWFEQPSGEGNDHLLPKAPK